MNDDLIKKLVEKVRQEERERAAKIIEEVIDDVDVGLDDVTSLRHINSLQEALNKLNS